VTKSLRLRLTLWYLAFFSVLMVLFSMFLYSLLSQSVVSRLDERLASEVNTAASLFQAELVELNGDVPKAAVETLEEMRPRGVLLAVFEGTRSMRWSHRLWAERARIWRRTSRVWGRMARAPRHTGFAQAEGGLLLSP
jgi:hypothetical protein